MSKIRVGHSPLGNKIFAGTLIRSGTMWSSNKEDVTIEALVAVCNHVVQIVDDVVISKEDGTPEFKIKVERM